VGTSANFEGPPNWGGVKSAVTRAVGTGHVTRQEAGSMVRSFVGKLRQAGRSGFGSGGRGAGQAARGRRGGGAGSVLGTAQAFGRFVSEVATKGLTEALQELGLQSLEGKTPEEIALALLDALCGPGSTIDAVDLRNALSALVSDLLAEAMDYASAEQALGSAVPSLEQLVQTLFGNYIYERFQTTMYATLEAAHGATAADSCLEAVRDYVHSELRLEASGRDLTGIDWAGKEGSDFVNSILDRTLNVFTAA
jgi:hypothetical protein